MQLLLGLTQLTNLRTVHLEGMDLSFGAVSMFISILRVHSAADMDAWLSLHQALNMQPLTLHQCCNDHDAAADACACIAWRWLPQLISLLCLGRQVHQLRTLRLGASVLYDAHLNAMAQLSQLRQLTLQQVSRT
jgi:hypothetical protein